MLMKNNFTKVVYCQKKKFLNATKNWQQRDEEKNRISVLFIVKTIDGKSSNKKRNL